MGLGVRRLAPRSTNSTVASTTIRRAFATRSNTTSQIVQVFGFMRLGRLPKMRKGMDTGPRSGAGSLSWPQQPFQILA
jgi:hypothetical protein